MFLGRLFVEESIHDEFVEKVVSLSVGIYSLQYLNFKVNYFCLALYCFKRVLTRGRLFLRFIVEFAH